jgi:hypothetical protein
MDTEECGSTFPGACTIKAAEKSGKLLRKTRYQSFLETETPAAGSGVFTGCPP